MTRRFTFPHLAPDADWENNYNFFFWFCRPRPCVIVINTWLRKKLCWVFVDISCVLFIVLGILSAIREFLLDMDDNQTNQLRNVFHIVRYKWQEYTVAAFNTFDDTHANYQFLHRFILTITSFIQNNFDAKCFENWYYKNYMLDNKINELCICYADWTTTRTHNNNNNNNYY